MTSKYSLDGNMICLTLDRLNIHVEGTSSWNKNQIFNEFRTGRDKITVVSLIPYSNYSALVTMNNSVGVSPESRNISFATPQRGDGTNKWQV